MNDMTRQARVKVLGGCAGLFLLAGCASVKQTVPETPPAAPEGSNGVSAAQATVSPPPEGGYSWDELARLAAARSSEAKVLLLEAEAERHQTAVETGWRNPQLRMGRHSGEESEESVDRDGLRKWDEREFDGASAGLRVYVANPFVNRWLRKRGAASVRAMEAASEEEKFAVFCEVKSLCLEAEMAREEVALLEQMAGLREQVRGIRREQTDAAVANALELIRAETRLAVLRSEISEKQAVLKQFIRRIAVLAGLPAEQVRLRPRDPEMPVEPACLDAVALTDLAFLRRPDLQKALHEKEAAEHGVKAAHAAQIPWFEYLEGSYETEEGRARADEEFTAGSERSKKDESEWQARVAVTLPIFNWLGDEVRLNRTRLAAAEARAQGLYDTIRREVEGVLEDYRSVRDERERVVAERKRLSVAMTAQVDALANESTVRREDVLAAREELVGYVRVCMKVEREYLRLTDYLETVSGGPLAPAH